jgi:DNA-binding PadR family transcriptional regulator
VREPFGNPSEGMGLAARVLLHLAQLPPLGPNDLASLGHTQQGMVTALAVRQGSLTKVLRRLLAGDAVTVERRYVAGAEQRLKVYRLSPLGETLARDLRHRLTPSVPSKASGEWIAPRSSADRTGRETGRLGA